LDKDKICKNILKLPQRDGKWKRIKQNSNEFLLFNILLFQTWSEGKRLKMRILRGNKQKRQKA